ncbi:unnamed protein product [Penicillium salamii]|uniref:Glucose-methanol-choline oxidoreductase N-terminal domain-containing protein n=1 Tax=Penicillium salamii TaxID=1612424 RepID=A0A9W4IHK9_9EURO|nr:unnamed protein product [Penicillium salamii]CAG7963963.1 unnamed protein product [Penicillium salamii]CAG8020647.1 unnamed protein product [Penicillium salamii]CAG8086934.1 unnamed protein product [Penicillium salamii]CAG8106469.1 unnamed protein product [Penicillium salamii]
MLLQSITSLTIYFSGVAANAFKHQAIPLVDETYDYVVVGAGTGGSAIATRLPQNNRFRVALVEAGEHYELESLAAVPAADVLPVGSDPKTKSFIDWGFVTTSQSGANGRHIHYARGKCLGGSPTRESMNQWATIVKDSSYEFDSVLPFYKKSVDFTPPNAQLRALNATAGYDASAYTSGDGGPLEVSYSNFANPFSSWMKLGMQAIGISETQDFNTGSLIGAQYCASTIDPSTELRSSSETAFIQSTSPLSSITIYTGTLAEKIIFDKHKKATGVRVKGLLGNAVTLSAQREVIISAGAFQSPQLLMLSGIGPLDTLKEHDIEVIADRPGVGQNMWDHPFFAPSYRVQLTTFTKLANIFLYTTIQLINAVLTKTGTVTNPIADFLGWEKIPKSLRALFPQSTKDSLALFPSDWPEAEYISAPAYIGNLSNPFRDQPKDGHEYSSILGVLITPSSRGNITLKSADITDLPLINPNWLDDPADQNLAVAIFKRTREAFQSEAMAPILIGEEYNPGLQVQSDAQILEWIKNNVMTLWHAACTCKMGTADDPMAVVDSRARVFGVQGLRVVDASAFPFLPPGHPQSVVCQFLITLISFCLLLTTSIDMLAEKIAADIIEGS